MSNSLQENTAIAQLLLADDDKETDFWIGGNQLGANRDYRWISTGLPMNYTSYSPGEPSGNEDCIHILRNDLVNGVPVTLWNDISCATFMRFICEWSPCTVC